MPLSPASRRWLRKDHKEEEGQGHHEVREAHEHGVRAAPEDARGGAVAVPKST